MTDPEVRSVTTDRVTFDGDRIWVLRPADDRDDDADPWDPWYDKAFGFIIRAETEAEARRLAQENAGDETRVSTVHHDAEERVRGREVWTDPDLVDCIPIEDYDPGREGEYKMDNRVLMKDFASA